MKLSSPRIILVKPSHPGNIGAVARAMKTMGLAELFLVSPKAFPHEEASAMATHAKDVLEQATVVKTIPEALEDITFVFATSANHREDHLAVFDPKEACEAIKMQRHHRHAILFGPENHGLSNEDLYYAHALIQIPTSVDYHSLNLAFAVQVIAYEYHQMRLATVELARAPEMEDFYAHFQHVLTKVQFLNEAEPRKLMLKLRRLFNRVHMDQAELNILRGFLKAVEVSLLRET
jgi:tRNA (cytidine32/uridine32-2'-O)-methyltransferase